MRKTLLTSLCMLFCIICSAEDKINQETFIHEIVMQLTDTRDTYISTQHKSPTRTPQVSYDNQHLYITPHYDITDAQVVIRDDNNNIIYDIYTTLSGSGSVIMLPENVMENKFCIELTYNEKCYIGFF